MRTSALYVLLPMAVMLCGCSSVRDYHYYPAERTYRVKADFDATWDAAIDYVSEKNYNVTNVEKESGIITIAPNRFTAAMQNRGYNDGRYSYSVQYNRECKGKRLFVIGNWNIRIKSADHWHTDITINIPENGYLVMVDKHGRSEDVAYPFRSTGSFEKGTYYGILSKIVFDEDEEDWSNYDGESH